MDRKPQPKLWVWIKGYGIPAILTAFLVALAANVGARYFMDRGERIAEIRNDPDRCFDAVLDDRAAPPVRMLRLALARIEGDTDGRMTRKLRHALAQGLKLTDAPIGLRVWPCQCWRSAAAALRWRHGR